MAWVNLPRTVRYIVVSVAAFFSAIVAVSAGITVIEPWIPAHRQLMRDSIAKHAAETNKAIAEAHASTIKLIAPTKIGMYDIQIGIARSRRSALLDQIFTAEIQAPKSDSTDELIKRRQQLQRLKDELESVEADLKLLREQREHN
jgi:hypothetical protein